MRLLATLALLCATSLHAQFGAPPAGITPIKPGQVRIIAAYVNANGKLVADTIVINVMPVAVATVDLFNAFSPPRWVSQVTVGKPFCAYAQAKDSAGNVLTGRAVVFTSSDTSIAKITASMMCPDTTIDASKMSTSALPPTTQTARRP